MEATKNRPNAAVINGKDWAKILPAIKVPPHNAATITSFKASNGVIVVRLALFIFEEYLRALLADQLRAYPQVVLVCLGRLAQAAR